MLANIYAKKKKVYNKYTPYLYNFTSCSLRNFAVTLRL